MSTTIERIGHTADVGLRVKAASAPDAFVAVAQGMFEILLSRRDAAETEEWAIHVTADDWQDLLVAWLEELLYRFEMEEMVPASFEIKRLDPEQLEARIRGERLDPDRHEVGTQIRAVTSNHIYARQMSAGFEVQIVFDI